MTVFFMNIDKYMALLGQGRLDEHSLQEPKAGSPSHLGDHDLIRMNLLTFNVETESGMIKLDSDRWEAYLPGREGEILSADEFNSYLSMLNNEPFMHVILSQGTLSFESDDYSDGETILISEAQFIGPAMQQLAHIATSNSQRIGEAQNSIRSLESDNSTLQSTVADLTARIEALENPTNSE